MYYFCENHSGYGGEITVGTSQIIGTPFKLFDGFMDTMTLSDDGNEAAVGVSAESKFIGLELNNVRRYTEEDQKIDFPLDQGLDFVSTIQDQLVIWGRG